MKKQLLTVLLFLSSSLIAHPSSLTPNTRHPTPALPRNYANFPIAIRPVNTVSEYFTGDWETDNARIRQLIAYVRQGEKKLDRFEQGCGSYPWAGEYKEVLTPQQRAAIQSIQSLHMAGTLVCPLKMTEPAWSMPSGEMFLNVKTIKKLSPTHFQMLIAHETAHRYTSRMFIEGVPDLHWQTELFADAVALWSLFCMQGDVAEGVNYLTNIPGKKGSATHPPHAHRQQFMTSLANKWLATKGNQNVLTSSFAASPTPTFSTPTQTTTTLPTHSSAHPSMLHISGNSRTGTNTYSNQRGQLNTRPAESDRGRKPGIFRALARWASGHRD